jgi:hypothetical protein
VKGRQAIHFAAASISGVATLRPIPMHALDQTGTTRVVTLLLKIALI